jgi:nucleotide-binding universal stress UspA family protein
MNKVYACIDGQPRVAAVTNWAIWSARRLDIPLVFVHVLQRTTTSGPTVDIGGGAGLASQEAPLEELATLDEIVSRQDDDLGQRLLNAACEQAAAAGMVRYEGRLRHGDLAAVALDLDGDARLFVLAQQALNGVTSGAHWEQPVERLVRAVHRPVLIVPGKAFAPPERLVLAFDGSPTTQRVVERVAVSPLLQGLPLVVAMVAPDTHVAQTSLVVACGRLRTAGFDVCGELHQGVPQDVVPQILSSHAASLLVMGAYGHSRIRQLLLGSTTITLLRSSKAPVLVLH